MKFSHSLQFNAAPDWASFYLSYSSLKKLAYQIERELVSTGTARPKAARPPDVQSDEERHVLLDGRARANTLFLPALNKELEKVVGFYYKKERELSTEFHSLKSDVNFVETCEETFALNSPLHYEEASRRPGRSTAHDPTAHVPRLSSPPEGRSERTVNDSEDSERRPGFWGPRKPRRTFTGSASTPLLSTSAEAVVDMRQLGGRTEPTSPEGSVAPSIHAVKDVWSLGIVTDEARERRVRFRIRALDLFVQLSELKSFVSLNHTGFTKILKKYDKITGNDLKRSYLTTVVNEAYPFKTETRNTIDELVEQVELIYAHVACGGRLDVAVQDLKSHLREHLVWERNTVWREMVGLERKATGLRAKKSVEEEVRAAGKEKVASTVNRGALILVLCLAVFLALLRCRFFASVEQQHCLAILVFVSMMWATEVAPLFVTSLLIPFLVIVLRVHRAEDSGERLSSQEAAKKVFSAMFSPVIMLLLGGFAIAAALSKFDIAKAMATWVLSKAGTKPSRILFANMLVATALSMWISNVAAPVLCFSLIQPILRTLPNGSMYARSLIIGIALASNIGGMASPISSPQNIIAIDYMDPAPSWLEWFFITLPIAFLSDFLIWLLLLWVYNPTQATPPTNVIRPSEEPLSWTQTFICLVTVGTVVFWCFESKLDGFFGDMGVVAIFPLVVFFGTGVLTKDELNTFPWAVIILAMGGTALGKAVDSSGLLKAIATSIQDRVDGLSTFEVLLVFVCLVMIVATFLSHTVTALIVLPVINQVGNGMPNKPARLLVMSATMVCSGAMGLPTSGFPNMNAIMLEDGMGTPYLTVADFLKVGIPGSLIVAGITVTVGYSSMAFIGF